MLLASMLARAASRLGDSDTPRTALHTAAAERDRVGEVLDGNLISCGPVGQHCFAAGALPTLGYPGGAMEEVAGAEALYRLGDPQAYRSVSMARVTGVAAHLAAGDLDGAGEHMRRPSALSIDRWVATLGQRLGWALTLLDRERFASEPQALRLREEITEFRRSTATSRALPAGR